MTNHSKYSGPGENSARQNAGDEPQQWAGDQDPLVELARLVGESAAQYRSGSRVESEVSGRPLFPTNDESSASAAQAPARASHSNDYPVGAAETHEPAQTPDSYAALDAVFASSHERAPAPSADPFAELSTDALSAGTPDDGVDYVSDLPPVPKARPVPQPKPLPASREIAETPQPRPAVSAAGVSADTEMDDVLSRDLEESLVASLSLGAVEREQAPRPQRSVSRATPTLDAVGARDVRPERSLRERLERRNADVPPVTEAPRTEAPRVERPVVTPAPAPVVPSAEPKALNELSENDYDRWRAERAAQRASAAAATPKATRSVVEPAPQERPAEPQLRGAIDEITPAASAAASFEPDMAAFAMDTGAELEGEHIAADDEQGQETVIPARHLEEALMAEFSLDDEPSQAAVIAEPFEPQVAEPSFEESVEDIFADEIAREPEPEPEPELEPEVAAELNEFERMSAGFEQAAQEIDPFASEGDDAWQLDESVANDESLDEMSWPAAAEKLAQTEAAHQEAMNAARKQAEDQSPPPGGYDLDAVAQAMRQEDPSLDGGVLPQPVPRVSVLEQAEDDAALAGTGKRKGLLAAASVAAILVVSGAGFFLFDFGGSGGDATPPPVIRADASAMKEVPAPSAQPKNDTAKVFTPQEASEPVNGEKMIQRENAPVTPLPPAASETDTADTPRVYDVNPTKKVRTVIVRPDGTIVQREPVAAPAPRITTSSVRNGNPQVVTSTPVPSANSGQWAPLPGESQSALQQNANATAQPSLQDAFANAGPAAPASNRPALAGVSVVPQSKPFVTASANTGSSVRSNTLAPLRSQPSSQPRANAPLNLTGSQGTQSAGVNARPVAPTPTPGNGVVGEIPAGTYIVQVASVRSIDQAKGQIRSYNRRYPNLMALVTPVITRADLGDKGVYYRIQVPFDGPTSANTFCGEFKSAGGDCYVRRN